MSELDDLSICKRIAEIERIGHQHIQYTDKPFIVSMATHSEYNPLTDDALCFQLMVKYEVSLIAPEREQEDWDCVIRDVLTVHKSPNKVICLAIIEVHKDKS